MLNIAIDGPSGAGKSTIAKLLAQRMGIAYLDTGAMYRALGLKALRLKIDPKDISGIERLLLDTAIGVEYRDSVQHVYLDGEDITEHLREHSLSKMASDISAVPAVRIKMAQMQRAIAEGIDCVLDGRDIGSYVLPNAEIKFFLTASLDIRALRRQKELKEKGADIPLEQVRSDIEKRDTNDMSRPFAPLKCVGDAIVIDSTDLSISEVVDKFVKIIGESGYGKRNV